MYPNECFLCIDRMFNTQYHPFNIALHALAVRKHSWGSSHSRRSVQQGHGIPAGPFTVSTIHNQEAYMNMGVTVKVRLV
jgi:hypothetical protein